jgi:hypothetical protein
MVAVPSAIAIWGFFDGLISADPAVRARQVSILLVLEVIVISVLMGACILVLERLVK